MANSIFKNYKKLPIDKLVKADWNYKTDNSVLKEKLKNNIKRNGQIENIIVRELNTGFYEIINGNHRYDALVELGITEVVVYDFGNISLSAAQRIAIETNETRFETDAQKLSQLLQELSIEFSNEDLMDTMPFDETEFNNLLEGNTEELQAMLDGDDSERSAFTEINVDEDTFDEEPPVNAKTIKGDLYEFNGHRLLCGDSTKADDVSKLMNGEKAGMLFTDPPYNIKYTEINKNRLFGKGKDWDATYCTEWHDNMPDEDYDTFVVNFLQNAKNSLLEYAHYYVWFAFEYYPLFINSFKSLEIPYDKPPIIWVKQVAPPTYCNFMRIYEPCIYGGKKAVNTRERWFGPTNEKDVWHINREHNGSYIHPTQKPVALAAHAIQLSSQPGEIVLDLFMGSGTTFIASEKLGRIGYGVEYNESYCDNIIKRFYKYCEDNNIEADVKLNGQSITIDHFAEE